MRLDIGTLGVQPQTLADTAWKTRGMISCRRVTGSLPYADGSKKPHAVGGQGLRGRSRTYQKSSLARLRSHATGRDRPPTRVGFGSPSAHRLPRTSLLGFVTLQAIGALPDTDSILLYQARADGANPDEAPRAASFAPQTGSARSPTSYADARSQGPRGQGPSRAARTRPADAWCRKSTAPDRWCPERSARVHPRTAIPCSHRRRGPTARRNRRVGASTTAAIVAFWLYEETRVRFEKKERTLVGSARKRRLLTPPGDRRSFAEQTTRFARRVAARRTPFPALRSSPGSRRTPGTPDASSCGS